MNLKEKAMHKKYDIIYSLGRDCACAMYMKQNKLRITSGPFDWLTNASFETRFNMILNDFAGFLSPDDIQFLPKNPNVINDEKCDYYENVRNGFYYYHDFPINVPMSESLPEVINKYNRRIARFYKNIRTKKRVLLIWFSHCSNTPDKMIIDLCNKVCGKFGKTIDFLIIEHKQNQKTPICTELAHNITKYNLHTTATDDMGRPTTQGNTTACNPLFAQFGLHIPWRHKITMFFINIVPLHNLRHKLRNNYLGQ